MLRCGWRVCALSLVRWFVCFPCYLAGLFGGTFASFGAILRETTALARVDLSKTPPRIAIWHDESYLNRVFAFNPPTVVLGPHYVYPEPPVVSANTRGRNARM